MIIPQNYIKLRQSINFDSVSLGFTEVNLFQTEELDSEQIGYRVDTNGNSLIDEENGGWKDCWFVIGYEDCCGDPIFIDGNDEVYPVFTAMHGEEEWEETLIATSFAGFIKALECVQSISKDRENPVKLEEKPIKFFEKRRVLKAIKNEIRNSDMSFWEDWLE